MLSVSPKLHHRVALLLLCLLALTFTFSNVWVQELHGLATLYAALAREMAERHDLLAPFLGERGYLLKPPLALWWSAANCWLFGYNTFAVTLASRLAGLGCVAMTYLLARRYYQTQTAAWFAALIFLTNGMYLQYTNTFRLESLMTFSALAMLWGYLAIHTRRGAAVLCAGITLSLLTKGLVILAMLPVFALHAHAVGSWRQTAPALRYWALLLALPAAWYGYLWFLHGDQLALQLQQDFWRGDGNLELMPFASAWLEYVSRPAQRWAIWLPLVLAGIVAGFARAFSRATPLAERADLQLLLALLLLNYWISWIKPEPDLRYLYSSFPLVAVLAGGLLSRWLGPVLPRWTIAASGGLWLVSVIFAVLLNLKGQADHRGLLALQARVAAGSLTNQNSVQIVENIYPPDAPRRSNPMPDGLYFHLGLQPPQLRSPQTSADIPAAARYVWAARSAGRTPVLRALGFHEVGRSEKFVLFERP
jgi:4-amino-4-deoxy-L-arabinose transferase-like glycosyltransferase